MRRRKILLGTLATVVVVTAIGAAYVLYLRDLAPCPGLYAPVSVVCPGPPDNLIAPGTPAIRPRNDCTPSFTQQDVRDYLGKLGNGNFLGTIGIVGKPTITRVVFLTDSADMVVCYADLRGTFGISGPDGGIPVTTAYIEFDAHTGNELGDGSPAGFG